jgi:hypothetical protein
MPNRALTGDDLRALDEIIQEGDNLEALTDLLQGFSMTYDYVLHAPLDKMISMQRNKSFEFCLHRLEFMLESQRDFALTTFLKIALFHSNTEVANFLLHEGFEITRCYPLDNLWWAFHHGMSHPPWNLEGMKWLVSNHPE